MGFFDLRTLRVLVTTLVFIGVLAIVYLARRMFLALLFAVFFAYLLEPAVDRVHRIVGGTRVRSIAVVYLLALVLIGGTIGAMLPQLEEQSRYAATTLPGLAEKVGSGNIALDVGQQHGWSYDTQLQVSRVIASHHADIVAVVSSVGARAAELGANVGYVILVPIFALFFLKDKSCMANLVLDLTKTPHHRGFIAAVLDDLDRMLAQYIRAQLILAALATVAYTVFLSVVQFPYALVLGVTAGVLEFVPFIGPAITAIMLAGIGFFSGYPHWLLVLLFVGIWRLIQDYVNTPYFMGEGLELHPLAAIFGILVGGEVFGIPGMFLSIPVIAGLRIVWHNWRTHEEDIDNVTASPSPAAGTTADTPLLVGRRRAR